MNLRSSSRFCPSVLLIALVMGSILSVAAAENTKGARPSGIGQVNPPQPFNIYSTCPPALCTPQWDGQNDPARGRTDFTPSGIPLIFSFVTGNPVMWQCSQQYEWCQATYGQGGSFSITGALGTFTGTLTSGYAYEDGQGYEISVTFSGQWNNGLAMHGTADEHFAEYQGIPDTQLQMYPGP